MSGRIQSLLHASIACLVAGSSSAAVLPGDLDGDGRIGVLDASLMLLLAEIGLFDPSADLDGNGHVDHDDVEILGESYGSSGGDVDVTPPGLFVTLNHIPDDQNDLLVVPPERFHITLEFDSLGHSLIDTSTLSVVASEDIGPYPAGTELGGKFSKTTTSALWPIPTGSDLDRTAFFLDVSVRDFAGNEATQSYGFAVRDFEFGPPMGNLQRVHLDFDQSRMGGPAPDFVLSLREFGLSSATTPTIELQIRDFLVDDIVRRVGQHYGRKADGSPGPDAANVEFSSVAPTESHARLCVGGEASPANMLGGAGLDENNLNEFPDECTFANRGVFPHAIDNLWGGDPTFQGDFAAIMPSLGGTPIGEHPADATVTDPGFKIGQASPEELGRFLAILLAVDSFSRVVSVATAHEVAHTFGLVAHGDAPGGLYGGTIGSQRDHNVTPTGYTPTANYLMNAGPSFTYDEMTARNGQPVPMFRPMNWAYLRDRIAPNADVTGLFPAPELHSVSPNPASFGGSSTLLLTFRGEGFVPTPVIELLPEGSPIPSPVTGVNWVDDETVTGTILSFFVPPGTYDVRFLNGDGHEMIVEDALTIE